MAGSFADPPIEVLWPSHMVDRLPLEQLGQLRRVCRHLGGSSKPADEAPQFHYRIVCREVMLSCF